MSPDKTSDEEAEEVKKMVFEGKENVVVVFSLLLLIPELFGDGEGGSDVLA